jgi:hypothetical protein
MAAATAAPAAPPQRTFVQTGNRLGARWQKVLFAKQSYADNHVDETFLASLVTNANVTPYDFWHMVRATAVVIQQISAMAMFFVSARVRRAGTRDRGAWVRCQVGRGERW